MCGSDEGNIRMWKSVAWRKEGTLNFRYVLRYSYYYVFNVLLDNGLRWTTMRN